MKNCLMMPTCLYRLQILSNRYRIFGRAQKINVVIYAPYNVSVQYDSLPNVAIASAPMSIMSIAAIYNHESLNLYDSPSSDQIFDFTAETAKILIVDDNSINLTVAEGLLEPLNMQIDTP